jgi:hypothetical protein
MPFTPIAQPKEFSKIKKLEFLKLSTGANIIRILDADYITADTHYVNRISIACLGDECPVCKNNRKIINENPETFRDVKGYYPRTVRYFINVLDRTPAKICPKCGEEIKQVGLPVCPKAGCGAVVMDVPVTPLNKVKVLSKGVTLFEQLAAIELSILDDAGTPRGLMAYDLVLIAAGSGKTSTVTPNFSGRTGDAVPEGLEKFDLAKALIKLTAEEILDFQKGVSLSDIFKGRSLTEKKPEMLATENVVELEDIRAQALKLFAQ